MSINILDRGEVTVLAPADLRGLLEDPERYAFDMHKHSVQSSIENAPIRLYSRDDNENAGLDALRLSQKEFPHFIAALGDHAVRSATMSFELFDEDISSLRADRDDLAWDVKGPKMHMVSDRIRFFVAKTSLGNVHLGDDTTAKIIERRTYAGIAINPEENVRPVDVRVALGVATRHEKDQRVTLLAPTSITHYAFKD
ncbi:MAG TPA: hypothetical protein VGE13_03805 [Candidatus Saccharimonadales bacterium]